MASSFKKDLELNKGLNLNQEKKLKVIQKEINILKEQALSIFSNIKAKIE